LGCKRAYKKLKGLGLDSDKITELMQKVQEDRGFTKVGKLKEGQ